MDPQKILSFICHSASNPELENLLQELNIKEKPTAEEHKHGVTVTGVHSKEYGISFDFTTKIMFQNYFGQPKSTYTDHKFELILKEITFHQKPPYTSSLPFDLSYGEDYESICKKLGSKPIEKRKAISFEYSYWFFKDDLRIQTGLDKDKKLLFICIYATEISERKNIQLKSELKDQNKNIHSNNLDKILSLIESNPTKEWENRLKDDDPQFTEKNLLETEQLLTQYLASVHDAASEGKANKIYSALKKAVIALNKLNEKHESFIDTLEREELVEFLHSAIKLTGFQIADGQDLTQEWREW